MAVFKASLPDVYSWDSQVRQYPRTGRPGVEYFAGVIPDVMTVDCLLYRDADGLVVGILNHYPVDNLPLERAGNVNIWVHPDWKRKGIGSLLWQEASYRWDINLAQQRFTLSGAHLANHLYEKGYR